LAAFLAQKKVFRLIKLLTPRLAQLGCDLVHPGKLRQKLRHESRGSAPAMQGRFCQSVVIMLFY